MASANKRKLSGSTNGRMIKVVATASTGTTIHTAVSGTTDGTYDEVWLWAQNNHTTSVTLTIEFGGTSNPDDRIITTLESKSGLVPIVPGIPLQNSVVVRAFAGTANVISIAGFVNAITD